MNRYHSVSELFLIKVENPMSPLGLEDQVIVALRRITRAIDLHSRNLMQEIGLTAPQLAALQMIARRQPITVGALAKSIHLSQATLTGILSRLESRQLVSRSRRGADKRTVVVELTDEGQAMLKNAPSLLQDRFRRELLTLQQWEQTQMLATLQRIATMMDAEDIDASPVLSAGDVSFHTEPAEADTDTFLKQQNLDSHS
ncbi:MarR family transcriptional regulator [Gimesia sp.]|uniref:MarR family winged helix-turn-helix transcriptional regulator n=1 Tax=Gimesia sp. TaxID=2024833 RepID=UPI0032ECEC5D